MKPSQVDLPSTVNVNGDWALMNNWLVSATLTSPSTVRPRTNLSLSDMFEDNVKFKDLMKPIPYHNSAHTSATDGAVLAAGPCEDESVTAADSASQVSGGTASSDASTSTPYKASKKLNKKELQAAVAKLAKKAQA